MAIRSTSGVGAAAVVVVLCLAALGSLPAHGAAEEAAVQPDAGAVQQGRDAGVGRVGGRRGLRCSPTWSSPPSSSWSSPPSSSWSSPPPSNAPWPYYSPPYYPWDTFPYTHDCHFDSTGVYQMQRAGTYPGSNGYTKFCFWIYAPQPDYDSHKECRNFDLWAVNFRADHDCETQVSDLTWNDEPLTPVWAKPLLNDKAMLQITRGGNSLLDTQANLASYKAKICFTLPNWCPLEKFCKGKKCKVAFYPSPYTGLNCCPSWDFPSLTSK